MKTVSPAMQAHLQSEVTTLCTCFRIVRQDGLELGFTSHDRDLIIDGLLYETANGFSATAIQSGSDLTVDNMDVMGVLDSDKIKVEDIRNRLFDLANVYVFQVNYKNLSMGKIPLRRGWFGEAILTPNGEYTIELRGLMQALMHESIEVYTPECRADFCDSRCKLNMTDFERLCTVTSLGDRYSFSASNIPDATTLPTTVGAHKHWRVLISATASMTGPAAISELRLWDQDDKLITGGDAEASHVFENNEASDARDDKTSTRWTGGNRTEEEDEDDEEWLSIAGTWWRISFGSAKDIKFIALRSGDDIELTPSAFRLEYTNDDPDHPDAVWSLAKTCTHVWEEEGSEAVWALGSESSSPINITDTPTTVPPPFEGASTYLGGSVKFVSGANSGMALEIIGYDASTDTVAMFDAPFYPLKVGDVFKIAQGCKKTPENCKTYDNYINYRGEPDVPGQDEYLYYPDAKS